MAKYNIFGGGAPVQGFDPYAFMHPDDEQTTVFDAGSGAPPSLNTATLSPPPTTLPSTDTSGVMDPFAIGQQINQANLDYTRGGQQSDPTYAMIQNLLNPQWAPMLYDVGESSAEDALGRGISGSALAGSRGNRMYSDQLTKNALTASQLLTGATGRLPTPFDISKNIMTPSEIAQLNFKDRELAQNLMIQREKLAQDLRMQGNELSSRERMQKESDMAAYDRALLQLKNGGGGGGPSGGGGGYKGIPDTSGSGNYGSAVGGGGLMVDPALLARIRAMPVNQAPNRNSGQTQYLYGPTLPDYNWGSEGGSFMDQDLFGAAGGGGDLFASGGGGSDYGPTTPDYSWDSGADNFMNQDLFGAAGGSGDLFSGGSYGPMAGGYSLDNSGSSYASNLGPTTGNNDFGGDFAFDTSSEDAWWNDPENYI